MQITFLFDQNAYERQKDATDLKRVLVETTLWYRDRFPMEQFTLRIANRKSFLAQVKGLKICTY